MLSKRLLRAGVAASIGLAAVYGTKKLRMLGPSDAQCHIMSIGPDVIPPPGPSWNYNWDKREPVNQTESSAQGKSETPKNVVRHIILIRHGQFVFNESDEECVLTEKGRRQAVLTGERLRHLKLPISRLVHSTMTRASETALIILDSLGNVPKVEKSNLLEEGAPYPPDPPTKIWEPEEHEFFSEGARIEAAFRHYIHRPEPDQKTSSYEVLVCHGNVIRYFVCRALQLSPNAWFRFSAYNGSITWLTVMANGHVTLRALGETGHMPKDAISFH